MVIWYEEGYARYLHLSCLIQNGKTGIPEDLQGIFNPQERNKEILQQIFCFGDLCYTSYLVILLNLHLTGWLLQAMELDPDDNKPLQVTPSNMNKRREWMYDKFCWLYLEFYHISIRSYLLCVIATSWGFSMLYLLINFNMNYHNLSHIRQKNNHHFVRLYRVSRQG